MANTSAPVLTPDEVELRQYLPEDSLADKKHIYGTYIEMAFHNFYQTMSHIYAKVFGADIMVVAENNYIVNPDRDRYGNPKPWEADFANEKWIWTPMFQDFRSAQPEEKLRIQELIGKHFPMLVPLRDYANSTKPSPEHPNWTDYSTLTDIDILEMFSKTMRILRNIYSHYKAVFYHNPNPAFDQRAVYAGNERFINKALSTVFLGAKRTVKERFLFDDCTMRCAEEFIVRNRQKSDNPNFRYKYVKKDANGHRHLTCFGLAMLTSLFLEKKFAKILTDKAHLVEQQDQQVICEMLSVYRIRLHVQKLHVEKNTDALALDILNELRRCPKELFEMLTPEDQNSFRVKPEEGYNPEVLMMRYEDRFPQLAMKYIDDAHLFDEIRFQVSLGKYFYKFYNKKCIDATSDSRVRALCKNVNGFGRIGEIETMRKELWDGMIRDYDDVHKNTADEKPYITDHHAQYVINNNRIGMYIANGQTKNHLPQLTAEGADNLAPTCWMSTYELPAMMFLLHLTDGAYVEEKIKTIVAHYHKLFNDIKEGVLIPCTTQDELEDKLFDDYGLNLCEIPKKMQNYLLGQSVDAKAQLEAQAKCMLDKMIDETYNMSERFKEQKKAVNDAKTNKIGKKRYVRIQPGRLAAFLAKDMMQFHPNTTDNKGRLTGLNFRILQSLLATYTAEDTDSLKRALTSAHIIGRADDDRCNPVVMRMLKKKGNELPASPMAFYEAYLQARMEYLKECRMQGNYSALAFIHADRKKWQEHDAAYYRELAGRYLKDEYVGSEFDKPIELPRRLFEYYICKELENIPSMKALAENPDNNVAYLIYGYFKNELNDDCQPFYDYKRCYRIFNTLYRKNPRAAKEYRTATEIRDMLMRKSAKSIRKDIDEHIKHTRFKNGNEETEERERLARMLTHMKNTETDLKRYKVQDMLLLLIAKRILTDSDMHGTTDEVNWRAVENIQLKNICDGETLSQKIRMAVTVCSKNGYSKQIVQNDLKLKNYSQFYQFLNDHRLPTLLDLVRGNVINRADIEAELTGYDSVHPSILGEVFGYEKAYVDANPGSGFPDFGNILGQSQLSNSSKFRLRKIRNSFAHLSYPKYNEVNEGGTTDMPDKAKTISQVFKDELNR